MTTPNQTPKVASVTPIYDQLVLEQAVKDPEGLALVKAIHDRNGYTPRVERRTLAAWFGWTR